MKQFFRCVIICIVLVSCKDSSDKTRVSKTDSGAATTSAAATDTSMTAVPDSAAMMKAWEAYMTPGEVHKMMAKSNGMWTEETTMYMSPGAPPEKMTGSCENSMMMNGLYQHSVHKATYNGMPFEGVSTLGFNNATKKFQNTWIDNMGSGMMIMEGDYDAASKTMNMRGKETDPMTGKQMAVRETFKMIDDKNQYMEMFQERGGKETKVMEVKYMRK